VLGVTRGLRHAVEWKKSTCCCCHACLRVAECAEESAGPDQTRRTIWERSESLYQRLYRSVSRELLRSALPPPSAALPGFSGEKNTPTDLFEATGRLPVESRCVWLPATVRGRRVSTG
jgi:hypothetical protein